MFKGILIALLVSLPLHYKGVNLAGGDNDYRIGERKLQQWPSCGQIKHWSELGLKTIRLPFHIIDLQADAFGPLDQDLLAKLRLIVDCARESGSFVVFDPHDYGFNQLGPIGLTSLSTEAFVDFWKKMASTFCRDRNVVYGLMNEPHMQTAVQWQVAAAAAVRGIRGLSRTQMITIPGTAYSSAASWVASGNAAAWEKWTDPNDGPFMFEMHQYLDADQSGTHRECKFGYSVMNNAVAWARRRGFKIFVGEFAYSTDETCVERGPMFVRGMTSDQDVILGWTWWSAGPEFGSSYYFNLNPGPDGKDQPQVSQLVGNLSDTVAVRGGIR